MGLQQRDVDRARPTGSSRERGPGDQGSGGFRRDIEGLRAVAVVLVLLFHAGVPTFSGGYVGVDVFFVISGFLITGLLVREIESSGSLDLPRFYARRVRRLLPASALTLVGVAGLTMAAIPAIRWAGIGRDIQWSALYGVNWRLASQAIDYLAAEESPSPVQHFWSLSVEEQFYVGWPVLLLIVTLGARRSRRSVRSALLLAMSAIVASSLVWSLVHTAAEPERSYYVTTTRVWELAIGGIIAVLAPRISRFRSRSASTWLSIVGLGGVLAAAVTYGATTAFPGYAALLPVLATGLVLVAGTIAQDTWPGRLLGRRPLQRIGELSYSLYLWHWPFLVAADALLGELSPWQGLVVVALSAVPARFAYDLVEGRWRHSEAFVSPVRRGIGIGIGLTVIGVLSGIAVTQATPSSPPDTVLDEPATEEVVTLAPIGGDLQTTATQIVPDPLVARDDLPSVYADTCHLDRQRDDFDPCVFGSTEGAQVVLVGDSHAAQWVPPLAELAEQHGWHLRTLTKSGCQLAYVDVAVGNNEMLYETCATWSRTVTQRLLADPPDLVIVAGAFWTKIREDGVVIEDPRERTEALETGLAGAWQELHSAAVPLMVIKDVPFPDFDVPECVLEHRDDLTRCAFSRSDATGFNTPHEAAAATVGVPIIDLTDWICSDTLCPAVARDRLIWRDRHHLTATYAADLAPVVEAWMLDTPVSAPLIDSSQLSPAS